MGFAHWNVPYIFFAPQRGAANRRRGCSMVPLCGTRMHGFTVGMHPIFFLRHQKENAPCTVEKKNVRDELTALSVNSPKTEVGRHALPTKLETHLPAALYSNLKSVRPPHQKVLRTQVLQIGRPLLLFPLLLPRLSLGGISKGESTKAPPGADKARCFRGNGTIGGPLGPGIVLP